MKQECLTLFVSTLFSLIHKIKPLINQKKWYLLTLSLTGLFLAHNISALFASGLILVQALFMLKDWPSWKKFGLSFLGAFAMGLWFWLPALAEKSLITLDGVDLTLNFDRHFPTLAQLLRLPMQFGYSYWGSVDSMSYGLGAIQITILFLALIILLRKLRAKKFDSWIVISLLLVLGQLAISKSLYMMIPFANFIQFPWRLSLLLAMTLVIVSATLYASTSKTVQKFLWIIVLLQFWQIYQLKPIDYQYKNPIDYDADSGTTSVNQENMPKNFQYPFFEQKQDPIFLLSGTGQISVQELFGSYRRYRITIQESAIVVESTAAFAGWETKANDSLVDYIDNEDIKGRIAYALPVGEYQIESRFTQKTWPRMIGNTISFLAALIFAYLFYFDCRRSAKMKIE